MQYTHKQIKEALESGKKVHFKSPSGVSTLQFSTLIPLVVLKFTTAITGVTYLKEANTALTMKSTLC